jgi:hypothetical protein
MESKGGSEESTAQLFTPSKSGNGQINMTIFGVVKLIDSMVVFPAEFNSYDPYKCDSEVSENLSVRVMEVGGLLDCCGITVELEPDDCTKTARDGYEIIRLNFYPGRYEIPDCVTDTTMNILIEKLKVKAVYTSVKGKMLLLLRNLARDYVTNPENSERYRYMLHAVYKVWDKIHEAKKVGSNAVLDVDDIDDFGNDDINFSISSDDCIAFIKKLREDKAHYQSNYEKLGDKGAKAEADKLTTQLQKIDQALHGTTDTGGGGGGGDEKLGDKGDNGDNGEKGEKIDQALNGTTDTGGGGDPFSKLFVALCLRF